jgi:hypothetical protein
MTAARQPGERDRAREILAPLCDINAHMGYQFTQPLMCAADAIAAALADAHAATETAEKFHKVAVAERDYERAQVATLTAERDDYSRTAIDALAEVAALRAALEGLLEAPVYLPVVFHPAIDAARAALQPDDGKDRDPGA